MTDEHDEKVAERLRAWAADYHVPPDTPRDAMWQEIAERRAARHARPRPGTWVRWGVGIAATLALGIAVGRMTVPTTPDVADTPAVLLDDEPLSTNVAYEVAALDHVKRVETFIKIFRAEANAGRLDGSFAGPGRLLAVQNRLLLDSPAANDPTLRQLLGDIELVLLQIRQYDATGRSEDLEFINDGIERRGVMLKMRSLATQGAT